VCPMIHSGSGSSSTKYCMVMAAPPARQCISPDQHGQSSATSATKCAFRDGQGVI
jgi:hypothetical protein